jgi:hypothetical protein
VYHWFIEITAALPPKLSIRPVRSAYTRAAQVASLCAAGSVMTGVTQVVCEHGELRALLRPRRHNQIVPASPRRA